MYLIYIKTLFKYAVAIQFPSNIYMQIKVIINGICMRHFQSSKYVYILINYFNIKNMRLDQLINMAYNMEANILMLFFNLMD